MNDVYLIRNSNPSSSQQTDAENKEEYRSDASASLEHKLTLELLFHFKKKIFQQSITWVTKG